MEEGGTIVDGLRQRENDLLGDTARLAREPTESVSGTDTIQDATHSKSSSKGNDKSPGYEMCSGQLLGQPTEDVGKGTINTLSFVPCAR